MVKFLAWKKVGKLKVSKVISEYDVGLDSKKRFTVRGKLRFNNYHVKEYQDGKIELEPRYLAKLDELSNITLERVLK